MEDSHDGKSKMAAKMAAKIMFWFVKWLKCIYSTKFGVKTYVLGVKEPI